MRKILLITVSLAIMFVVVPAFAETIEFQFRNTGSKTLSFEILRVDPLTIYPGARIALPKKTNDQNTVVEYYDYGDQKGPAVIGGGRVEPGKVFSLKGNYIPGKYLFRVLANRTKNMGFEVFEETYVQVRPEVSLVIMTSAAPDPREYTDPNKQA